MNVILQRKWRLMWCHEYLTLLQLRHDGLWFPRYSARVGLVPNNVTSLIYIVTYKLFSALFRLFYPPFLFCLSFFLYRSLFLSPHSSARPSISLSLPLLRRTRLLKCLISLLFVRDILSEWITNRFFFFFLFFFFLSVIGLLVKKRLPFMCIIFMSWFDKRILLILRKASSWLLWKKLQNIAFFFFSFSSFQWFCFISTSVKWNKYKSYNV